MTSNSATTHHNGVNGCNGNGSGHGHPDVGDRWPVDVGIVSMEVYFPNQFVEQSELEEFDGASTGHYTKGLLQTRMGFCGDNEDVNSLSLTVVDRLMRKSGISYKDIGMLEVGTETIIDKSKSVKSVVMKLFEESGNHDVEGVDSHNACYGGTAALFKCVNWVESSSWDGRYALVVCADIAVYAEGNARPTGGAGAVAMIVGPNAALVFERGLRANHAQHAWDFYKPNMASEYPTVDGPLSNKCYLSALDKCYQLFCEKASKKRTKKTTLSSFDALLFHTPYCKLVKKSVARLALNDFLRLPRDERGGPGRFSAVASFADVNLETTYEDKSVEKAFMESSADIFREKTEPSLMLATNVGNMYTPSLYGGLISYLCSESLENLPGRRLGLFSYGSGLVASFYSIVVSDDSGPDSPLAALKKSLKDVQSRLDVRTKVHPSEFEKGMKLRESVHNQAPYSPKSPAYDLFPGTWYLTNVDKERRRTYAKTGQSPLQNGLTC